MEFKHKSVLLEECIEGLNINPKGIYVGTISKIENSTDLSNRYALVELGVNFDKLETVLVVTN